MPRETPIKPDDPVRAQGPNIAPLLGHMVFGGFYKMSLGPLNCRLIQWLSWHLWSSSQALRAWVPLLMPWSPVPESPVGNLAVTLSSVNTLTRHSNKN